LAVSRHLGLATDEIAAALASYKPADMRLNVSRHGSITVINDSYNANPSSMTAAIDVLVSSSGRRRVLVAGDMLELGDEAAAWHERIGGHAGRSGVELVVAVGSYAQAVADAARAANPAMEARTYGDAESAGADLAEWLRAGDVLLVKGSRALGMERVAGAVAAFVSDGPGRGVRHAVPAV
jgi:UDP-N-acetylmuramoyl-tripeptide--D-alanyl-D-alanine ligase